MRMVGAARLGKSSRQRSLVPEFEPQVGRIFSYNYRRVKRGGSCDATKRTDPSTKKKVQQKKEELGLYKWVFDCVLRTVKMDTNDSRQKIDKILERVTKTESDLKWIKLRTADGQVSDFLEHLSSRTRYAASIIGARYTAHSRYGLRAQPGGTHPSRRYYLAKHQFYYLGGSNVETDNQRKDRICGHGAYRSRFRKAQMIPFTFHILKCVTSIRGINAPWRALWEDPSSKYSSFAISPDGILVISRTFEQDERSPVYTRATWTHRYDVVGYQMRSMITANELRPNLTSTKLADPAPVYKYSPQVAISNNGHMLLQALTTGLVISWDMDPGSSRAFRKANTTAV
ncbi:hypothetical protein B0T17DRAFT_642473 [Bombardia bombarda]|uniref:Uncharacterized protein n=1 Tax=Bombardia bombarda TaxID=252184 RepID=A0AA39WV43_9PEZI|nr:hypothetical protein B0T17DRAFT_642473 [Bombardia bombarda]